MTAPLLVMAAGGTGGHMFPAQALAEAMLARGWRVRLSTDDRGARYTGGFPAGVVVDRVASATFARGGIAARAMVPARIAGGVIAALRGFRRDRPAVVVGFGGYPSIPALMAATILRLPRMIHEQNGVLGKVNTRFAPRVDAVACGTWPTALPPGVRGEYTGNPVRAAIRDRAGAAWPGGAEVLVIGGSQGARILSDVVPAALALLPEALKARLRIAQQARPEDLDRVMAAYGAAGIAAEVQPFFDDVPERLVRAALVVSRSGASSVADIACVGRPAILIPFAAAAQDHQTANSRGLEQAGAAVVIPESALDPAGLAGHIAAILSDPARAGRMAVAAAGQGRPDATERLVKMALAIASTGAP